MGDGGLVEVLFVGEIESCAFIEAFGGIGDEGAGEVGGACWCVDGECDCLAGAAASGCAAELEGAAGGVEIAGMF